MYKVRNISQCNPGKLIRSYTHTSSTPSRGALNVKSKKQAPSARRFSSSASKSGSSALYIAGTLAMVGGTFGGAAVAYAKYDEGFRKSLEENLSFVKPVLDSLYGNGEQKNKLLPEEKDLSIPFSVVDSESDLVEDIPAPLFSDNIVHKSTKEDHDYSSSPGVVVMNTFDSPSVSPLDLDLIELESKKNKPDVDHSSTDDISIDQSYINEKLKEEDDFVIIENSDEAEAPAVLSLNDQPSGDNLHEDVDTEPVTTPTFIKDEPLNPSEIADLSEIVDQTSLEVLLDATIAYVSSTSQDAINAQKNAESSLRDYIKSYVQTVLLPKDDPLFENSWKSTSEAETNSQLIIEQASNKSAEIKKEFENLKELIKSVKQSGPSDIADNAASVLNECVKDLENAIDQFNQTSSGLEFISNIHTYIDGLQSNLQYDLKLVLPNIVELMEKNIHEINFKTLPPQDALIGCLFKQSEMLKEEISNSNVVQKVKVEEMLEHQAETLRRENEIDLKVRIETLEKEHELLYNENLKSLEDEFEREMLVQLKRQASAHNEHLSERLSSQSAQLLANHKEELERKIKNQREENQFELEKQLAFIHGIQTKISEVVHMDEKQRRSQEIWIASHALSSALQEQLSHGRTRTLMPEMLSILHLAGNNTIIEEIIDSFPDDASTIGVVPEKELLSRFKHVKSACKKVALIGEDGGALPLYALSYLKSLFVFSGWYRKDVENKIDVEELGPYEILAKAEISIENNDLEQAAKFMSQLKGVARKLCSDWLRETRLYLETKQTASLLMAYASSLSVSVE